MPTQNGGHWGKKGVKDMCTSENHLEKRLWLLISTNCPYVYLWEIGFIGDYQWAAWEWTFRLEDLSGTFSYLFDSLMESFWASALHSDVFPVPGGPGGMRLHKPMKQLEHTCQVNKHRLLSWLELIISGWYVHIYSLGWHFYWSHIIMSARSTSETNSRFRGLTMK